MAGVICVRERMNSFNMNWASLPIKSRKTFEPESEMERVKSRQDAGTETMEFAPNGLGQTGFLKFVFRFIGSIFLFSRQFEPPMLGTGLNEFYR